MNLREDFPRLLPMPPNSSRISDLQPGSRRDELVATVALIKSKLIPSNKLPDLLDLVGSSVAVVQASDKDRLEGLPIHPSEVVGAVTPEIVVEAANLVETWARRDWVVVTSFDPAYPSNLREVFNRPALLFIDGTWDDRADSRSIAIVGARAASEKGLQRARRLASELVEADFTILSGLAAGIDTAAHVAALEKGGRTIAVMGTGLSRRYPRQNADLAARIARAGALVTHFFPHQTPARWTFPLRNIVMSGLSQATVVVEASHSSGARMQARIALQHGRTVFLLRSLVQSHQWAWDLVNEGRYGVLAVEISSTEDIVGQVNGSTRLEAIAGT